MARFTRKQMKAVGTIYDLVSAVPLPADGSQSTTIKAIATYAADMKRFRPMLKRLVSALMDANCGAEMEGFDTFDEVLAEINDWLEQRTKDNWQ